MIVCDLFQHNDRISDHCRDKSSFIKVTESQNDVTGVVEYLGRVFCPFCGRSTAVFNVLGEDSLPTLTWNSSNFDRHMNSIHDEEENELKTKKGGSELNLNEKSKHYLMNINRN